MALQLDRSEDSENDGLAVKAGHCPSCEKLIIVAYYGGYSFGPHPDVYVPRGTEPMIIFPRINTRINQLDEVPREYTGDFDEASNVLMASPKASAALSRRCLQRFFHEHLGIKKANLAHEITEFVTKEQVPSYIADAVDEIRKIGNLAAHPQKNTNTGEILDVEPGEAEWLLEVLELLFDFYFVYPKKIESRKAELQMKLGKPLI